MGMFAVMSCGGRLVGPILGLAILDLQRPPLPLKTPNFHGAGTRLHAATPDMHGASARLHGARVRGADAGIKPKAQAPG
jgi:hypothetical protein